MEDLNILLDQILNETDEFIFVLHPKKGLIFHNNKYKSLGYSKSEFKKITPENLLIKQDLNSISELFHGNKFHDYNLIIHFILKDKTEVPINTTIKPFVYKGDLVLIIRAADNLSKTIHSENIDPVTYWKNIADSFPEYVSICDLNFNITYINRLDHGEKSNIIGLNILNYGNGIPREILKEKLDMALNGKKSEITYFIQLPDGDQQWYTSRFTPLYLRNSIYSILTITSNISHQKEIEKRQQESEDNFKQIVEHASDIVYTCDEKGEITYINPVGVKISGLSEVEIIGKNFNDFVREDYAIATKAFYKHQFDNKTLNTYYEFPYRNENGKEYWIGQSLQLRIKNNKISSVQALARDITARKLVEKELMEAKVLAEESLKAKENFLSVMSHEIRTPLNAVVGLSNLMMAEKHSDAQKEYLDGLKFSTDNLLSVINDVLDFSKIESKKIHLENIDFNLSNLLKRVQEITRVAAIKKGLDVDLTIDSTIPKYVKGDPVRLNQILVNLVSNAIKFTNKGTIELIIFNKKEHTKTVEIQFVIKDTGIGIEADRMKFIFDPFTQANSHTARKYGGSGLGLTISKNLVVLMKGKIKVDSKVNKGSTFKVNIIFGKTKDVIDLAENEKSISLSSLSKNLKVLIVEDNEMNQFVLQKNLDNWNIAHDEAFDGEQALKIVKNKKYDLILLDLEMPKMNGYELSKEIRSNEIDTPIIAISATSNPKCINRALSNGANDFLSKPVDNKLLISKIIQYTSLDNIIQKKGLKSRTIPNNSLENKTVNLDYLISSSAGDTTFMEKMINSFIINTPGYLKQLNEYYSKNELGNLKTEAHKFKATISIMGVIKGKKLIEKLENAIENNTNIDQISEYLTGIEKESNLACKELATILTKSLR